MNKFAKNFGISLLGYAAISFLGFLAFVVWQSADPVPSAFIPRNTPLWAEAVLWFHVIISIALYFYLGTKLKLLNNHLLNFLSASGGLVFGFLMLCIGSYALILTQFSFFGLVMLFEEITSLYVVVAIVSALPSIITWIGMVYKARKNKRITNK